MKPTAQALLADEAATPVRNVWNEVSPLKATFHDFPFQRSIRALAQEHDPLSVPTAQAFLPEVVTTPLRNEVPGLGLCTRFHDLPLKCSVMVCPFPPEPTAHTLDADDALTALSV